MRTRYRSILALAFGAAFCAALAAQQPAPQPQPNRLPQVGPARPNRGSVVPKADTVMPQVPAGFTVTEIAQLQAPRMMVFAPNGDLFVSSPAANNITVLRDADRNGSYETRQVFIAGEAPAPRGGGGGGGGQRAGGQGQGGGQRAGGPPPAAPAANTEVNPAINGPILGADAPACADPQPFANRGPGVVQAPFGLAFNGGFLYVGNTGSIVRIPYQPGDLTARGPAEKLLDLPVGGHSTRNIVFNRAGTKMYIAVGSQSNNNAGEDCRRAAVLEFNPDGTGYRVYASGLRNPVGLALQPGTDIVWTAVNERDNLGDDLVPDYATSLRDGGFYGWPYSYIGSNYDPRYQGAQADLVRRAIVPDVLFPSHSAALGVTFYTGTAFPQRYRNGGFVALHGSWNRSTNTGAKVVFFPMNNGRPGPIEDFLTGFVVNDGSGGSQIQRWGRPVGVAVAPDGSLLVSDDGSNRIWRVSAAR
jgi:glucose/arabinose dehydrogenase